MKKEERFARILAHFKAQMPHVTTELEFGSVFQLLVAVILSAQCTDKRINQVTPAQTSWGRWRGHSWSAMKERCLRT